jgi:murein L,D-transpeptidase YcbB/YkuD
MRPIHSMALTLMLAAPVSAPAFAVEPDAPAKLVSKIDAIRLAVQTRLGEKFTATTDHKKEEKGALVEYYSAPDQKLLWVDENGMTERGEAVIAEIAKADDYGLRARDYALPELSSFDASAPNAIEQLAEAEVKISHAVMDYAHDARGGRINPLSISRNLDPTLSLPKPIEVIESISYRWDPAAYLRSFQPQNPQFDRLRKKLVELRGGGTEAAKEEKPVFQMPSGPLLKFGVTDPQVALLRTRLDIPEGENPELYDAAVLEAVKRFQIEHNTAADGLVGPGTRRLLNAPHLKDMGNEAQINKILLNMERWRWLPQDQGRFFVTVNVPEFTLRVVRDDETIHQSRVVVGKTNTPTPVFSNEMKTVVFGPYWNVPTSIKVNEIRPYVRRSGGWFGGGWNTAVFQRHDLRIKYGGREVDPGSLDWNRVDIRSLHLYQPPGPRNVLGRVKFMFPNKHDVYMHDTPQKHLFAKQVRAESHGCVRVQNPDQLAAIILQHDKDWSPSRTQSAFDTAYNRHVGLNRHIPVYVTYFTIWINEDGSVTSFGDLYGHDRRMAGPLLKTSRTTHAEMDDGIITQSIPSRSRNRLFDGFN